MPTLKITRDLNAALERVARLCTGPGEASAALLAGSISMAIQNGTTREEFIAKCADQWDSVASHVTALRS